MCQLQTMSSCPIADPRVAVSYLQQMDWNVIDWLRSVMALLWNHLKLVVIQECRVLNYLVHRSEMKKFEYLNYFEKQENATNFRCERSQTCAEIFWIKLENTKHHQFYWLDKSTKSQCTKNVSIFRQQHCVYYWSNKQICKRYHYPSCLNWN